MCRKGDFIFAPFIIISLETCQQPNSPTPPPWGAWCYLCYLVFVAFPPPILIVLKTSSSVAETFRSWTTRVSFDSLTMAAQSFCARVTIRGVNRTLLDSLTTGAFILPSRFSEVCTPLQCTALLCTALWITILLPDSKFTPSIFHGAGVGSNCSSSSSNGRADRGQSVLVVADGEHVHPVIAATFLGGVSRASVRALSTPNVGGEEQEWEKGQESRNRSA